MKVLDLQCAQSHVFEGWFGSECDFQSQLARSLLVCPLCGDRAVTKRLSAPRLNLGATPPPAGGAADHSPASAAAAVADPAAASQARWLRLLRQVVAHTDDVGDRLAQEARRIHHGEVPARAIRGRATAQEAAELLEEGVEVVPLPMPVALKSPMQ